MAENAAPAFSEESIRDAAAMINAAESPVLDLGGGALMCRDRCVNWRRKRTAYHHDFNGALGREERIRRRWVCWGCTACAAPTIFCRRRIC
ncbi:hypothetical protein ACLK1S_22705 [Escherichia coli]